MTRVSRFSFPSGAIGFDKGFVTETSPEIEIDTIISSILNLRNVLKEMILTSIIGNSIVMNKRSAMVLKIEMRAEIIAVAISE